MLSSESARTGAGVARGKSSRPTVGARLNRGSARSFDVLVSGDQPAFAAVGQQFDPADRLFPAQLREQRIHLEANRLAEGVSTYLGVHRHRVSLSRRPAAPAL
jgi:hypothetical protein